MRFFQSISINITLEWINWTSAIFRSEKEKAKFQQELYELLAQVDSANKDKVTLIHSFIIQICIIWRVLIDDVERVPEGSVQTGSDRSRVFHQSGGIKSHHHRHHQPQDSHLPSKYKIHSFNSIIWWLLNEFNSDDYWLFTWKTNSLIKCFIN